ncbi:MAG: hypothetical protein IJ795_07505 [Bacteroidales bacterium]|nr:hypothetical protein [Bacteroidales bacterium]
MKKIFTMAIAMGAVLAVSCNKRVLPDVTTVDISDKCADVEKLVGGVVDNVILPTYQGLSDEAENLYAKIVAFNSAKTQANLDAILPAYKATRALWERSEAFLYGAAGDSGFGIDGHIDDWPFDFVDWPETMADPTVQAALAANDLDDVFVVDDFASIVGFHAIEFVCFADGKARELSTLDPFTVSYTKEGRTMETTVDLATIGNYLVAIAADLRNYCYELEVSWTANPDAARKAAVEKAGLSYRHPSLGVDYGTIFKNPGDKLKSVYDNWGSVLKDIIEGAIDICTEVGTEKIGYPYFGYPASDEDVESLIEKRIDYIESPYSWNSISDFYNNILSIKNVYYGGEKSAVSLHSFLSANAPKVDEAIVSGIEKALSEIGEGGEDNLSKGGMKYPFAKNSQDASVKEAIDAVTGLQNALEAASALFD